VYGGRIRRDFDGTSLKQALLDLLEVREAGEGEAVPERAHTVAAREK
jgi:hypothetical protein